MAGRDQEEQSDAGGGGQAISLGDNEASNIPVSAPSASMESSAVVANRSIQEMEQRMHGNLTMKEDPSPDRHLVLGEKFENDASALGDAARLTKSDDNFTESPSIDMSIDAIRRWLSVWKARNENGGTDLESMHDDLELRRSANSNAFLEIDTLLRAVSQDVNGLKKQFGKEYKCLEAFEPGAEKLGSDDGVEACPYNDLKGFPNVITKQLENSDDLETTIKHLEEKLEQNEKDYLEAEAAMESRLQEYDLEIADLHAQAIQLDKEEQSMRMLIALTSKYLESQKHMNFSNDVAVVSIEDGRVELRVVTYICGREDQMDSGSTGNDPFLEHNLTIKVSQETMEIEEAKLTPDDVPMKDLLSVIQERKDVGKSSGSTHIGEIHKLGPQLLPLITFVHDWQMSQACQITSGRQRTEISKFANESQGNLEHESPIKEEPNVS